MKFKIFLIIIILTVLGSAFYWFQWRPAEIRKGCFNAFIIYPAGEERNILYEDCLKFHGLEE